MTVRWTGAAREYLASSRFINVLPIAPPGSTLTLCDSVMNISDLTAEAEKLARTGSLLRKIGFGDPVAYWHAMGEGEPCVSFRSGPRWLTVHLEGAGGVVSSSEEPCRSLVPLSRSRMSRFHLSTRCSYSCRKRSNAISRSTIGLGMSH